MKNFVFINHKCSQALVLDIAWTTNIESVMWVNELKKNDFCCKFMLQDFFYFQV